MNEIFIYDEIGPDYYGLVSAKGIIDALAGIPKGEPVTVRINSPGGSVTEGQAIYNALLRHSGDVTIEVDSLAASMGSYIAMAGKSIRMAENAMLMIHNPWTVAIGDAAQLRQTADVMDKFQRSAAEVYAARSGQTVEDALAMMAAETWLTAQEAVDKGFADSISQPLNDAKARVRPGMFANTPNWLVNDDPSPAALKRRQEAQNRIEATRQQLRLARARVGV